MRQQAIQIFCDFDGTITPVDCTDFLLERLADASWRGIEERWEAGEIGSRECMAQQVSLIRGGWQAVRRALDEIQIDSSFVAFANWCRARHLPLHVVSDGIDRVIHHVLSRQEIIVDSVVANHLVESSDGQLLLMFPHCSPEPVCSSGVCKCRIVNACLPRVVRLYIGDGRSDFCAAGIVDHVFAKGKLVSFCQSQGIPHSPFESFKDIMAAIEESYPVSVLTAFTRSAAPLAVQQMHGDANVV